MGRIIKFKPSALPLPKGSKEGSRCLSIGLSPDTAERVDKLVDGDRLRSAWVERTAQFMAAVQEGDEGKTREWATWCREALGEEDLDTLATRLIALATEL